MTARVPSVVVSPVSLPRSAYLKKLNLSVLLSGGLVLPALAQPTFTPVGDLPGGSFFSECFGVSRNGQFVCGTSSVGANTQAFLIENGTMSGLPDQGAYSLRTANAVANNGVVVGEAAGPNGTEAYKQSLRGSFRALGGTVPGGFFGSAAYGIGADGRRACGSRELAGFKIEPCIWNGPSLSPLGYLTPSGFLGLALGVSSDGSVVVGSSDSAAGSEAFMWTEAGGMVSLGDLPGGSTDSEAAAVNDDGSVIVGKGRNTSATHAFRWAGGVMTDLGDLPGGIDLSKALGVSGDGSVVVGQAADASGLVAFIWDASNGMRNLKSVLTAAGATGLTGWTLRSANAISADGKVIVGTGVNPAGNTEGWIVRFPDACPADFNGDGFVDGFDYDDFVACFEGDPCPPGQDADYNNDGFPDGFDYDEFVAAFEAGCL